jgi:serine/threonine protein phosphatase PrpC
MEAQAPPSSSSTSYNNQWKYFYNKKNGINNTNDPSNQSYHGQIFYPQDIYYNTNIKEALMKMRQLKRKDHLELANKNTKELQVLQSCGNPQAATLTLIGYKGGTLESQINQDRAIVISPFHIGQDNKQQQKEDTTLKHQPTTITSPTIPSSRLIAVFDGHARLGENISQYAVTQLPNILAEKLDRLYALPTDDVDVVDVDYDEHDDTNLVKNALIDTFIEIDRNCPGEVSGGCTASVVLQQGSKLYVANAGDSRSFVVVYRPSRQTVEIIYISREDKPHLPDERRRVEECGGQVFLPPLGTSRVLYTDPDTGMQSGLAMSRSIGDWEVGKLGVIPDPIVDVIDIDHVVESQVLKDCQIPEEDGTMNAACFLSSDDVHIFAVSATDGLMDFASPEMIAQAVALSLYDDDAPYLLSALEQIIYLAASGWEKAKQGRYRDDIAISVTEIRRPQAVLSKQ